jgi:hypothetical protein
MLSITLWWLVAVAEQTLTIVAVAVQEVCLLQLQQLALELRIP